MGEFRHISDLEWEPVRPDLTRGVFGKTLHDGIIKVVLTKVTPGGRFETHRDPYGHLFQILEGEGRVRAGNEKHPVGPGDVVRIPPGELHGYENAGPKELIMLSLNLPD